MNLKTWIGALVLSAIATGAFADDHAVRISTEGAYPPYNFINDNGEVDYELSQYSYKSAGVPGSVAHATTRGGIRLRSIAVIRSARSPSATSTNTGTS